MSEEEIITIVEVTPGGRNLVEKTKEQQLTIEEVLANTDHFGKENLQYLHQENVFH